MRPLLTEGLPLRWQRKALPNLTLQIVRCHLGSVAASGGAVGRSTMERSKMERSDIGVFFPFHRPEK